MEVSNHVTLSVPTPATTVKNSTPPLMPLYSSSSARPASGTPFTAVDTPRITLFNPFTDQSMALSMPKALSHSTQSLSDGSVAVAQTSTVPTPRMMSMRQPVPVQQVQQPTQQRPPMPIMYPLRPQLMAPPSLSSATVERDKYAALREPSIINAPLQCTRKCLFLA